MGQSPRREKPGVAGRLLRAAAGVGLAALVAACASSPDRAQLPDRDPRGGGRTDPSTLATPSEPGFQEQPGYISPRHLAGTQPVRVALLLPLSSDDPNTRRVAKGLRDAAQLGLFEVQRDDLVLILKDTGGTPTGAADAAQSALTEGAEIILGPLFADSVNAVAEPARRRNVPVVAFSSDRTVGRPGVYLLSFQVEEEIRRVVRFAAGQQFVSFAALVPRNSYGDRVTTAFVRDVEAVNGDVRHVVTYEPTADDFRDPVRQLAEYGQRKSALQDQRRALERRSDEASRRALQRIKDTQTWGPVSYQAVLLPDGGSTLRSLAPTLPYYDIDNRTVRFLGTGLWDDPSLWNESALQGGWFAAPPPNARDGFTDLFQATFDYLPPRIASLGYDAVTLAAALAAGEPGDRFTPERLTNANGFAGIDGIFRFLPDGGTERGLAILEIQNGGVSVVGPAPTQFDPVDDPIWGRTGS